MATPIYIIVTPAKDEGEYLQRTIDSVARQVLRPRKWVIVDDGSKDTTARLIEDSAKQHPWIVPVHGSGSGSRRPGAPHIEAFYNGLALVGEEPWDYLVKMDADVTFEPFYFERCLERFRVDPRLGIGGGVICFNSNGVLSEESRGDPSFHVRGATKIYRRACWEAIGGIIRAAGWDTADEFKANMLGWKTCTFKDLKLDHLRHAGASYTAWKHWVKNGLSNYISGYHPLFMIAKCLSRAVATGSPVVTSGLLYGFMSGYFKRVPRIEPEVVRYVRREQIKRLCLRPSLWG